MVLVSPDMCSISFDDWTHSPDMCSVSIDDWTHSPDMCSVSIDDWTVTHSPDVCLVSFDDWTHSMRVGNLVLTSLDMCLVSLLITEQCEHTILGWCSSLLTCVQSLLMTEHSILGWCSTHLTCVQSLPTTEYTILGWCSSFLTCVQSLFMTEHTILRGGRHGPCLSWHVFHLHWRLNTQYERGTTWSLSLLTCVQSLDDCIHNIRVMLVSADIQSLLMTEYTIWRGGRHGSRLIWHVFILNFRKTNSCNKT